MSGSVIFPSVKKTTTYGRTRQRYVLIIVVAPITAETDNSCGKKVRLSIVAEDETTERRDSVMAPAPRLSESRDDSNGSHCRPETEFASKEFSY